MPPPEPVKLVQSHCPSCGPARIRVLLQGAAYCIGIDTPNWSSLHWIGRCCSCLKYLEISFDEDSDLESRTWAVADREKVRFVLGKPSPS